MVASKALNILVVDDDPACVGAIEDFLVEDGHAIATATRGFEAVALVRERGREGIGFDLSILDFDVPDLSGLETFERLIEIAPRMGAIFISGGLNAALESSLLEAGGFAAIAKPLDLFRMRRAVLEFGLRF